MKTKGNRDYLISLHKKRDDLLQSLIIKVMRERGRGREKNKKKKGTLILGLASKASFSMEALFMMLGSAVHPIRTRKEKENVSFKNHVIQHYNFLKY
ncbi:hypothetical protein ACS0TY_005611 [Phlomoides rotata]